MLSRKSEYRILGHQVIKVAKKINEPKDQHMITYQVEGLPPRTVWIMDEEYNEKNVEKLIQDDIKTAKKEAEEGLKLF